MTDVDPNLAISTASGDRVFAVTSSQQTTNIQLDRPELYGMQILRGIAAILVVFHHSLEESLGAHAGPVSPDWLITFGAAGVDIFFTISGFIMLYVSFPANRSSVTTASFLVRRVTRIYPLYWIFCLAVILLSFLGYFKSQTLNLTEMIASILLFPLPNRLIGVSWTLSYEIYFYLIFSATLVFRSQIITVTVCIVMILSAIAVSSSFSSGILQNFFANPISLEFCFGLLIGLIFVKRRIKQETVLLWSIIGFVALACAPVVVPHANTNGLGDLSRVLAWGLPSALILYAFLSIGPPQTNVTRLAVAIGDCSYAIYLSHFLVMIIYARLLKSTGLGDLSQIVVVPVIVAFCISLGAVTHFVIEQRLIEITRRIPMLKSFPRLRNT